MKTQSINIIKIILLASILSVGVAYIYAAPWTGPTSAPPGNNAEAPLNVSNYTQTKGGGLLLGQAFTPANSSLDVVNGWVDVRNGGINMHEQVLTGVRDPIDPTDGVNKRYLDSVLSGGGGPIINQNDCSWHGFATHGGFVCPVGEYVAGICLTNSNTGCGPIGNHGGGDTQSTWTVAGGVYCCKP